MHIHLLSTLALWLMILSCSEAPFEPGENGPEGYQVYFWNEGDLKSYMSWEPDSDRIETITLPCRARASIVSPDGRSIWTTRTDGTILQISLDSRTIINELPSEPDNTLAISPDGELLASCGKGLKIIQIESQAIMYEDTITCSQGQFSSDGTKFFCLSNGVYSVDLANGYTAELETISTWGSPKVQRLAVSPDGSRWYMQLTSFGCGTGRCLATYFPDTDSFSVFEDGISDNGRLVLSPDGRYLVYTGDMYSSKATQDNWWLKVIDTHLDSLILELPAVTNLPDIGDFVIFPRDIVITPDNRWIVTSLPSIDGKLLSVDLENSTLGQLKQLGIGHSLYFFMVQSQLAKGK